MPGYTQPALPVILTKKDWDKNKGVVAKMAGETGIGAECDKVAAAYRAVDWAKFDLVERARTVLKNWSDDTYNKANRDKIVNEAKAEMTGDLTKLSVALQKLRDVCQKAAVEFKKSRTIPASSTAHVAAMAKAADHLSVAVNKNSMTKVLVDQIKILDANYERITEKIVPSLRKVAMDQKDLIAALRADPTPANFNTQVRTIRNLTQNLSNYAKLCARGYRPADAAVAKAAKDLTPWADGDAVQVKPNASTADVVTAIDKLAGPHRAAVVVAAGAK